MNKTIPWVEKYRPTKFDDIILEPFNRKIMEEMLNLNQIPNMLFYGPPGTGKTTTVINFINRYQEKYNQKYKELIIHLNASDDRGIDIIRNKISSFANSSYLFNKGTKFIVLDEVDYMTKSAQFALGKLIKENHPYVRFCLISNYISKIDKLLQNLCMPFKFNTLPDNKIRDFLINIVEKENLSNKNFDIQQIYDIITYFKSDVRSMINYIQGISQTNIILTQTIINNNIIKNLLINIKTNPIQIAEQKFTKQFLNFNIEKHEFVVKILTYISNNYDLNDKIMNFIKTILHCNNYYLEDFNKFFISKLSELLQEIE